MEKADCNAGAGNGQGRRTRAASLYCVESVLFGISEETKAVRRALARWINEMGLRVEDTNNHRALTFLYAGFVC